MKDLEFYICKKCCNLQVVQKGEKPLECCLVNPKKIEAVNLDKDILKIEERENTKKITSNYVQNEEDYITCICFISENSFVIDYYFPYEEIKIEIPNEKGILYIHINEEKLYKCNIEGAK